MITQRERRKTEREKSFFLYVLHHRALQQREREREREREKFLCEKIKFL